MHRHVAAATADGKYVGAVKYTNIYMFASSYTEKKSFKCS